MMKPYVISLIVLGLLQGTCRARSDVGLDRLEIQIRHLVQDVHRRIIDLPDSPGAGEDRKELVLATLRTLGLPVEDGPRIRQMSLRQLPRYLRKQVPPEEVEGLLHHLEGLLPGEATSRPRTRRLADRKGGRRAPSPDPEVVPRPSSVNPRMEDPDPLVRAAGYLEQSENLISKVRSRLGTF